MFKNKDFRKNHGALLSQKEIIRKILFICNIYAIDILGI